MSLAAAELVRETGIDPHDDVEELVNGLTPEALLDRCLDGVETDDLDRRTGWAEYVSAVCLAAGRRMGIRGGAVDGRYSIVDGRRAR